MTIPESIASSASFFCSSQHFSETEDLGNGRYRLTFGEYAASGLSGSMMIRATTNADETTTGTITAGDGEKEITVFATGGGESGTGVYADEAIMKDGLGNAGMSYGGYDYSTNPPTQIGLFDSSVDNTFTYRLYINRKNVAMSNVTVRDTLPDGMYFSGGISCHKIDPSTMTDTGEAVPGARVSLSGQRLTVHLGDIAYPVAITYRVFVPAQASMYLRNRSEVTYQIPVEKRWRGPAAKAVTVRLLADGAVIESAELTERGEWKHAFTGLKKYDPTDGHEIEYRIAEEPMEPLHRCDHWRFPQRICHHEHKKGHPSARHAPNRR